MQSRGLNFSRLIGWGKLITITGSAQMLVQGIGLLSGILIVRLLPTKEYALYTLANTMLGTMTVLADGGISSGVMAIGGRVWQDRHQLGVVVSTGLHLRRQFAVYSLLVSMPILFYLLMRNGASLAVASVIILTLIPAFYAALSDNLLEVAPKLNQDVVRLQKNQLAAAAGRFLLILSSLFFFPFTFVAILGNGISRLWANMRLKKISSDFATAHEHADQQVRTEILSMVKRTLPGAIYFCVSGQITIWLISIFGSTEAIAHIGAISRLTTVLTVITTVFGTLFIPRFARLPEKRKLLISKFVQIQLALLAVITLIVTLVVLFPSQILWVLGKNYQGLNVEILMLTISACLSMLAGVTYSATVCRGWMLKPIINIPINIAFQVILVFTLDLSKTVDVLMFAIIDFLVGYLILLVYFIYKVNRIKQTPQL